MSTHSSTYLLQGTRVSINDLPKVSLHDHLDGGLRPQTIIELAAETGFALPADDPVALAGWFAENANSGSLPRYIETFEKTVGVMQTASALRRVAREFVQDLSADGVVYAEVRWAPEQHLRAGLSLDDAVVAVRKGFADGTADVAAVGRVIKVSQILCALRHQPNSAQIAELALAHRDTGVVAFDIAGPELGFPPADHAEAFELLAENFFPVTVHAGEADGLDSIRGALLDGRALRIGHGVRLAEDITLDPGDDEVVEFGPLATWILDRGIALELSPQSNLQTGAIAEWGSDLEDHPFDLLYQLGFPVTVNPDNRLMSNTSISKELYLLAEVFDYDLSDFELFQLNAAAAAFLPVEDREDLADQISAGFADAGS